MCERVRACVIVCAYARECTAASSRTLIESIELSISEQGLPTMKRSCNLNAHVTYRTLDKPPQV